MIVQNVSEDGTTTDLTFTVPASDYDRARDTIDRGQGRRSATRASTAPPTSPRSR